VSELEEKVSLMFNSISKDAFGGQKDSDFFKKNEKSL